MASEQPSAWAITEARHTYLYGRCKCDEAGACPLHLDIAAALDAAKADGVEECHANRDHADRDARASAADRLGLAWAGGNLPPMWDDILDAARNEGRREREAEIAAWLSLPCGRADHDDRWCPVCNDRSELADNIKRGAGREEDK